jgi:hypothetical protein
MMSRFAALFRLIRIARRRYRRLTHVSWRSQRNAQRRQMISQIS